MTTRTSVKDLVWETISGGFTKARAQKELEAEKALAKERDQGPWAPDPVVLRQAQKAAGELLWLATRTRVDLPYTMHRMCSVVSSNPARAVRMQKRVLRYLKMTADVGVLFTSRSYLLRCEGSPEIPLSEHYLEKVLGSPDGVVNTVFAVNRQMMYPIIIDKSLGETQLIVDVRK